MDSFEMGNIERAAKALRQADLDRVPCEPIRSLLQDADLDAAYQVQRQVNLARQEAGDRMIGRKIGLTSQAVRDQLGVSSPDFGAIYANTAYGTGTVLPADQFIAPKIEGEVALVLSKDIDTSQPTLADIIAATHFALCSIEIVESRMRDWDIGLLDTVADNASYGGIVLGGQPMPLSAIDLGSVKMTLSVDGIVKAKGQGSDCMGHPLNAAVWLARTLAQRGDPLRAGEIVLTGALGPMVDAVPGSTYSVSITGMETVSVTFAKAEA